MRDERGKEVPFQTEARLAMQEPLNLQPNDVPATGGAALGTGGGQHQPHRHDAEPAPLDGVNHQPRSDAAVTSASIQRL